MQYFCRVSLFLPIALLLAPLAARGEEDSKAKLSPDEHFVARVLPLFQQRCFPCHGERSDDIKAGLDMRGRDGLLKGGDSGMPAVVPGRAEESRLLLAVSRQDPELAMPPKENDRLSVEQIEWIRHWIDTDAPWPSAARIREIQLKLSNWNHDGGITVATSGGLTPEWSNRKYAPENLWSYEPLRRPAIPDGAASSVAAGSAIDAFIGRRLAEMGLRSAPLADRRTLIRRATFDLIGLPPSPQEIDSFLSDPDPDAVAFTRVLERLLASPQYGEKWGRHWLDVVRYADSSGFSNDYERGNAWRYRDYVVRSMNGDKPYDQFVREQLAGDEIAPDDPEMSVAVGFLRMGPWELTGMEVPKVARQRFLDDVTETVGQVFLAHPLQCARCHDHKFDPVPTRDYYRIQAVFATTQLVEREAAFLPSENTNGFDEVVYLEARKDRYDEMLKRLDAKMDEAGRKWALERGIEYVSRFEGLRRGVPEDRLPPQRIGLNTVDLGMERIARKGLERLRWEFDRYRPVALSVYSGRTRSTKSVSSPQRMPAARITEGELESTCILTGGDPFSPSEAVSPGVLSAACADLAGADGHDEIADTIEGRRRKLAEWISSPENPLTARVMVNRIWQWHFGQGIAGNPNNFGATGKKPTHPELLDWLAVSFIESGWSIKAMHRLIMLSEAYRRAADHPDPVELSARDTAGMSYAAFQRRRLTAEELRDAMLKVSGELNLAVGGIPVRPELDFEVALQPRQVMGTFAAAWQPSPRPEQRHRRSLYVLRLRGLGHPFFEVFDQPTSETSCERREASTGTLQALALFNNRDTMDRALACAARLLASSDSRAAAIENAFRDAFGRLPARDELAECLRHWDEMTARHQALRFEKPTYPRQVTREAVEENTGEKFTFDEPLDVYGDYVPDLHLSECTAEVRGLAEVCLVLFNANEFLYVW